jgi:hypothetical protein
MRPHQQQQRAARQPRAELDNVISSPALATALAENYVGAF